LGEEKMKHELKIWPQYFCRVEDGSKTFEVRKNDRGFQPGDVVVLREYDPTEITHEELLPMGQIHEYKRPIGYTGKSLTFRVGYLFPIDDTRVVFSLLKVENETV
jgi:hypothetical protein